jgi:hypothetical protein
MIVFVSDRLLFYCNFLKINFSKMENSVKYLLQNKINNKSFFFQKIKAKKKPGGDDGGDGGTTMDMAAGDCPIGGEDTSWPPPPPPPPQPYMRWIFSKSTGLKSSDEPITACGWKKGCRFIDFLFFKGNN